MKKYILLLILTLILASCSQNEPSEETPRENIPVTDVSIERESKIPPDAVKMNTQTDAAPVKSLSSEYSDPVPLSSIMNSAGAEDSPFIMPDGKTLYFFFTPDVRVPVEKQLLDGVTGIYVSKKDGNSWAKPERVVLQDSKKLSLDGCLFVSGNDAWFCSAREGYTGVRWFKANYIDGKWQNWENADAELKKDEFNTGELHIFNDELYFHSDKAGGNGGLDIWVSKKINGEWQTPENVKAVNTAGDEGWPAISPGGNELWFYKNYGIWRSKKINNEWQEPEQMFSPLAGEPTIDNEGNVYFVHHFFDKDKMIEADIYVAYKK